jgi:hypothetical protein
VDSAIFMTLLFLIIGLVFCCSSFRSTIAAYKEQSNALSKGLQAMARLSADRRLEISRLRGAGQPIIKKIMAAGDASEWADGPETSAVFYWHELEDLANAVSLKEKPSI